MVQSMTALPTPGGLFTRSRRRLYGRNNHPAQLNFGDCMVYGAAKAEREPLLFKGPHLSSGNFSRTYLEPALKD